MYDGAKLYAKHIYQNNNVLIWVDSDVDGYTSAAGLTNYTYCLFPAFARNNITFKFHPGKEHGIVADEIPNNIKLVIAPDSSSNDYEEHRKLKERGIDVLVIDHHEADRISEDACIINISSSRDRMSQPQSESYTAANGGIHALTHALAVSLSGKVRVNSISPGWIDTDYKVYEGPDAYQQMSGRVGNPMDIANMVLFLCSDKAGFITGENICIDGGMTRQMIYHGDHGWSLE